MRREPCRDLAYDSAWMAPALMWWMSSGVAVAKMTGRNTSRLTAPGMTGPIR